jgi:hypothetical protein
MRVHHRLPALALAVLVVSCETLAGSGGSGAEFTKLKQSFDADRARLDQAVADGAAEQVADPLKAVGASLDEIQAKSSPMNLMDRENLNIQVASARQLITSTQQWVANADIDAVRAEVQKLDGVLNEIDVLLDRAIRSAATPAPSPQ